MLNIKENSEGLLIYWRDQLILNHTRSNPIISIGTGNALYEMHKGNFKIENKIINEVSLTDYSVDENMLHLQSVDGLKVTLQFEEYKDQLRIKVNNEDKDINRFCIRLAAEKNEKVFGGGEQYSHFNLRGKNFPIWVSEQGVGRNKNTRITQLADEMEGAGGDYYTTYFPQPTFISSNKYFVHIDSSYYINLDFTNDQYHSIEVWGLPDSIVIDKRESFEELMFSLTNLLGRQHELPDWVYNGMWLGVQGGKNVIESKLNHAIEKGLKVSAIWAQDWEGIRMTTFGKQLMWDWSYDNDLYPDLDKYISKLKGNGIRFTGYINQFLATDGELYKEAKEKDYLVKTIDGEVYQVYITTFPAAIVDLTNPEARQWLKEIIKENMVGIGLSGWMADFGEYLPTDCKLYDGSSGEYMHNQWPVLWAKLNYEAIDEIGKLGEVVYFTRAGYSGTSKYSTLVWAGDQNVDFSYDDGLASVIPAALSSAVSGIGFHHSDIGGYTTFSEMNLTRSKELFMRWTEQASFTPIMRTHEGNRPYENWQFDSDEETLEHFIRFTNIHYMLKDYLKESAKDYIEKGIPVIRPLFFHYDEHQAFNEMYEYLLGRDLLIAPIINENQREAKVFLPNDNWIHLWTGKSYNGGFYNIEAEIGYPPVFYRRATTYKEIFENIVTSERN